MNNENTEVLRLLWRIVAVIALVPVALYLLAGLLGRFTFIQ